MKTRRFQIRFVFSEPFDGDKRCFSPGGKNPFRTFFIIKQQTPQIARKPNRVLPFCGLYCAYTCVRRQFLKYIADAHAKLPEIECAIFFLLFWKIFLLFLNFSCYSGKDRFSVRFKLRLKKFSCYVLVIRNIRKDFEATGEYSVKVKNMKIY